VGIAGYGVRMARKLAKQPVEIEQVTIERQCDNEFIKDLAPAVERNQAVVSFGCAAGVQAWLSAFPESRVPALDTQFMGILEEQATWTEKCMAAASACWRVRRHLSGHRCAKHMLNGPVAARPASIAKWRRTSPAPGSSFSSACSPSASSIAWKRFIRPRTGAKPGTAAHARSYGRNTGSRLAGGLAGALGIRGIHQGES